MKGLVRTLFVSSLLLFGAFTASPAAAADPVEPLQLALGDSWAFGFGGNPDPDKTDPYKDGYVPKLHEALKEDFKCLAGPDEGLRPGACPHLELDNRAQGGAVTAPDPEQPLRPSLIGDQLLPPDGAIALLEARNLNLDPRDDVAVTTVHIGGNDVFGPILAACLVPIPLNCLTTIQDELGDYRTDLNNALSMLRDAAGDEAIVIGTYDNPFRDQSPTTCPNLAGNPLAIALGNLVLEGGPGVPQGLHDIMRLVAADPEVKARVAEVFGDLNREKDWFDCLHPTQAGYDKVSEAFLEALRLEQSE